VAWLPREDWKPLIAAIEQHNRNLLFDLAEEARRLNKPALQCLLLKADGLSTPESCQ